MGCIAYQLLMAMLIKTVGGLGACKQIAFECPGRQLFEIVLLYISQTQTLKITWKHRQGIKSYKYDRYASAVVSIMKRIVSSVFTAATLSRRVESSMMKCLHLYFLSLCYVILILCCVLRIFHVKVTRRWSLYITKVMCSIIKRSQGEGGHMNDSNISQRQTIF